MKHINEHINNSINEARDVEFRVAFNDALNSEGLPITVSILVPGEYKETFLKYLEKEMYNTIAHAEDWRGNPIED